MKILQLQPGSEEWHQHRLTARNASELQVVMGQSSKASREDLLDAKSTGIPKEYSDWVEQVLFARGHEIEAKARPMAEKIVGQPLYPVVATDDNGILSASYDGLTLDEVTSFECKQWNAQKAEDVMQGTLPMDDYWQVAQQLAVGAEQVLYMVTDGTPDKCAWMYVRRDYFDDGTWSAIGTAWGQFEEDLLTHEVRERHVEAVGQKPKSLPALSISISGEVSASNLDEFRERAIELIEDVPEDLKTDQDFADAAEAVKWCKEVEQRLALAKERALSETQDVATLMATIDEIADAAKKKRLAVDRLVKERKASIKAGVVTDHKAKLAAFVEGLEPSVAPVPLQTAADFAAAVKGKRSIEGMIDACDDALTREKVRLHEVANAIRNNLATIRDAGHEHLFPDIATLATETAVAVNAVVKQRIAEFEAARAAQEAEAQKQAEPPPEPVASAPKAAPTKRVESAPAPPPPVSEPPRAQHRAKPSDDDIIATLARAYGVDPEIVVRWLRAMSLGGEVAA